MIDITHKISSLRKAVATAVLKASSPSTVDMIRNKAVPKGDVFEFSRAAGLLAIKRTSESIPDCHPLPIEFAHISHELDGLNILIRVEVHTIYKTGVEVEAMHGAAITALTMYDMLKPVDKNLEIGHIRLEEKKGGKSQFRQPAGASIRSAVIVCSDSVSQGKSTDGAGKAIMQKLQNFGLQVAEYQVIPDVLQDIQQKAIQFSAEGFQLLIFTGGTGLSPRDLTPDAISPLLDREIPGIMEAARSYGQQRTPYAMLSRGVAGFIKNTLVLTLPGSVRGAEETMDALFPYLLHIFSVAEGFRHTSQ